MHARRAPHWLCPRPTLTMRLSDAPVCEDSEREASYYRECAQTSRVLAFERGDLTLFQAVEVSLGSRTSERRTVRPSEPGNYSRTPKMDWTASPLRTQMIGVGGTVAATMPGFAPQLINSYRHSYRQTTVPAPSDCHGAGTRHCASNDQDSHILPPRSPVLFKVDARDFGHTLVIDVAALPQTRY